MPVNTQHKDYKASLSKWQRCRDVAAGQDAVHAGGETYLPKLVDQTPAAYKAYKERATFYNATWRTLAGLVGMLFRKPPKIEVPETIKELLKDVDAAGQPFQLFLQSVSEEAMEQGRVGVLVDYPVAPPNITQADAQRMKLRPTMQLYDTFSIINWRTGRVNNQTVLTRVVLKETETVQDPKDEFVSKEEDRWRVLDLMNILPQEPGNVVPSAPVYRQRLYKMADAQTARTTNPTFTQIGNDIIPQLGNASLDHIPFFIMGTDDVSPDVDEPPLIDLVDMNLSHYRTTADYSHGCHFSGLPTLFIAGLKKDSPSDKIYIGGDSAIVAPNEKAQAKWLEITSGFEALVKKLDREEQQMAILGARMLEPQRKAVEAADTASIHRKGEESMLSSIAQAISLGMTAALKQFTEWAGTDPTNVLLELNRDFFPVPMDPSMLTALLSGWQQGAPGLSDQGLFDLLKAGEIVAEGVTLEEEQARVTERQQQLADQAAALQGSISMPGGAAVDRTPAAGAA